MKPARAPLRPIAGGADERKAFAAAPPAAPWRGAPPMPAGPRRDLVRLLARLYVDGLEESDERESRM